ncbi:unnamed protein product, partial [Polarella glacialis]
DKHGYCGYHFHLGSAEDKPWCRTKYGCGQSSIKGSWVHCDERSVERRRADDGKLYSAFEFKKYGGKDKWMSASKFKERRLARNGKAYSSSEFRDYYIDSLGEDGWTSDWTSAQPETRKANDEKWYTFDQFQEHYGKKAWDMWASAVKSRSEL